MELACFAFGSSKLKYHFNFRIFSLSETVEGKNERRENYVIVLSDRCVAKKRMAEIERRLTLQKKLIARLTPPDSLSKEECESEQEDEVSEDKVPPIEAPAKEEINYLSSV